MGSAADAAYSLHLDRVSVEATRALRDAGVPAIVLKGPSITLWLYADGEPRRYRDCDILVPQDRLPAARASLAELGYTCRYAPLEPGAVLPRHLEYHEESWRRADAKIELHWRIPGVTVAPEHAWELLAADTESLRVGFGEIPVLAIPARALHVALHCAQHGGDATRTTRDVERLVAALPDEDWPRVVELANALGATGALAAGLAKTEPGRAVVARHAIPGGLDDLHVALRAVNAPRGARGLDTVGAALAGRATARDVVHVLFPPAPLMRMASPLAARGRLGLVSAYGLRLVGRIVRLPRAWRDLRRARRLLRKDG
jgi:hypothetical protein